MRKINLLLKGAIASFGKDFFMDIFEFAGALCALGLLAYCHFEDSKIPPRDNGEFNVTFDAFYAWLAREILLPLLQQLAKAPDSIVVYPNEIFDIMPTVTLQVPQVDGCTTCIYEIDVKPNASVKLTQLEKQLTHKLRRALAQRLQIPVNDPCLKRVSVKLIPNVSGTISLVVYIDNHVSNALCQVITTSYAQQHVHVFQKAQNYTKIPPKP